MRRYYFDLELRLALVRWPTVCLLRLRAELDCAWTATAGALRLRDDVDEELDTGAKLLLADDELELVRVAELGDSGETIVDDELVDVLLPCRDCQYDARVSSQLVSDSMGSQVFSLLG